MGPDEKCTEITQSIIQCPDGFALEEDKCVFTSILPANVVCPDGAELNPETQKCFAVKQESPRCPKKYNFCPNTGRCFQVVPEIPAPCPSGFHPAGSMCQQTIKTPAEQVCPDGYSLDTEKNCFRSISIPPKCHPGFQHSRTNSDTCEKIVSEIPKCPVDTFLHPSNSFCEIVANLPIIETCPPGFDNVNGRCERYETIAPRLSCTNDCYKIRTSRLAYACANDMKFQDDTHTPKCVGRSPCGPLPSRCLTDSALRAAGERNLESLDAACSPCQQKPEIVQAQPYCPDGGFVQNNECVVREPITPVHICDVGNLDENSGQCIRTVTVPLRHECPSGSARQGNICVSRSRVQPDFICPEGTETGSNGSCVVSAPLVELPPIVEKTPASLKCFSGTLAGDGNSCIQVRSVPVDMICPPNAHRSQWNFNRCVITTEMIVPPPVEKIVRSSYVCPDGTRSPVPQCYAKEVISPLTICADDAVPTANGVKCIKKVDPIRPAPRVVATVPVPICPVNTKARGTSCVSIKEAPVILSCGEGYYLHDKECIKVSALKTVCPAGTTETAEGCLREIITTPLTKIVQGCTHIVESSCTGCPRTVTTECH